MSFNPNEPTFADIDPELYAVPAIEGFASGIADDEEMLVSEGHIYRECSCGKCGAPLRVTRVSKETFEKTPKRLIGGTFMNFTDEELHRHYGIKTSDLDWVIYDNSSECSDCYTSY